nr:10472_t:CDS:2 [Entrophospora candida]CAG8543515.1 1187_t:CDS:2 [Entrophospora candida]
MNKKNQNPIAHLTSGALSGFASCVLLQPFDLVKTRLQQYSVKNPQIIKNATSSYNSNSALLNTVINIIRQDSVIGLWRGTIPTIIRNVPGTSLYFLTLSEVRYLLSKSQQSRQFNQQHNAVDSYGSGKMSTTGSSLPILSNRDNMIAGMFARGSVGFVMMPITVIKIRYESNLYAYKSVLGAFTSIVKNEGIKGLFYGSGSTVIRDAPYSGLYVLFYERCKLLIANVSSLSSINIPKPTIHMTSAIIAGLSATMITHPFDMLKTRLQLKPIEYKNLFYGANKIIREEGFLRLFDGMSLRLSKKTVQAVINWTLYESLINWFYERKIDE